MKIPFIGKAKEASELYKDSITVSLTPLGKQKAEGFALEGPRYDVLSCLLENGALSIGEIAKVTNFSANKVRDVLKSLIKSGYAKKIS